METKAKKIAEIRLMASREYELELVGRTDNARGEAEEFARASYRKVYGAELNSFCNELLVLRDSSGSIASCVGINMASAGQLFLEQYLDMSVEQEISSRLKRPVDRSKLAEVGTLATGNKGLCRLTIIGLAGLLKSRGVEHVVITGVKSVCNALGHLGVPVHHLAHATAEKLEEDTSQWGSYYDASPEVVFMDMNLVCSGIGQSICQLNNETTGALAMSMKGVLTRGIALERGMARRAA